LVAAAEHLVALLTEWNDDDADRLFADNVALDESYARRAAAAAALTGAHGELRVDEIVATTAVAGTITYRAADGHRGSIDLRLSPHVPPLIQDYELGSERPNS